MLQFTAYYYALPACVHYELWNDSHALQEQQAESDGLEAVLPDISEPTCPNFCLNCLKTIVF
jgi:hypothetical protein